MKNLYFIGSGPKLNPPRTKCNWYGGKFQFLNQSTRSPDPSTMLQVYFYQEIWSQRVYDPAQVPKLLQSCTIRKKPKVPSSLTLSQTNKLRNPLPPPQARFHAVVQFSFTHEFCLVVVLHPHIHAAVHFSLVCIPLYRRRPTPVLLLHFVSTPHLIVFLWVWSEFVHENIVLSLGFY